MKFKTIFKYTFKLLCLAFVIERSTQCFIRFFEKPQAVEIKMSDGLNEILPHFQICPENQYNHTVFEDCGLTSIDFQYGIKWIGNGSDYCNDPKLILEKAKISLDQSIEKVRINYVGGGDEFIDPRNQSYWKYSDSNPYDVCHIFFLSKSKEAKPINKIAFYMKSNVFWKIISPGTPIATRELVLYNISDVMSVQNILMEYEVYHLLDYNNQACQPHHEDHDYLRDECIDASIFKVSMEQLNCTKPSLKNKNHICTDQELAREAKKVTWTKCPYPCKYLNARYIQGRQRKSTSKKLVFFFPKSVKTFNAYFAYSLLSLIAEVGGYVGLVLGWSFYQITNFMDLTKDSWIRKLCHLFDGE